MLGHRNNLLFVKNVLFLLLFRFRKRKRSKSCVLSWWFIGEVTPVLIPNTEVKLFRGDGTLLYRRGE